MNLCPCSIDRTKNETLKCCSMSSMYLSTVLGKLLLLKNFLPEKTEEKNLYYCRVVVLITKININHVYSFNFVVFFLHFALS